MLISWDFSVTSDKQDTLFVASLAKGLAILRAFGEKNPEMSLAEIVQVTGPRQERLPAAGEHALPGGFPAEGPDHAAFPPLAQMPGAGRGLCLGRSAGAADDAEADRSRPCARRTHQRRPAGRFEYRLHHPHSDPTHQFRRHDRRPAAARADDVMRPGDDRAPAAGRAARGSGNLARDGEHARRPCSIAA